MSILTIIQHLIFGMFLGAVIGVEREKNSIKSKFAGIRTYTLIGLFGVLLAIIEKISVEMFVLLLAAYILLSTSAYVMHSLKYDQNGGTSELAAMIVLIAGYFVGNDNYTVASTITIVTAILLIGKERIHEFAKSVSSIEMKSVIQFVTIAFIVLPLLPNENYGPLESFNPYVIWTMIVLMSGISFLSYLAMKTIGTNKGISLSGFLGGFISSTAVTLAFSQNSKKYNKIVYPFVFGIVISSTAMFFRLLLAIFIINPELAKMCFLPLASAGVTGALLSGILWKLQLHENCQKAEKIMDSEKIDLGKPLDLVAALKFGLLFSLVIFVSKLMTTYFGNSGLYFTSFISALVDTDAITVSLSNLAKNGSMNLELATIGITIAAMTNTIMKSFYTLALGSKAVAIRTTVAVLIMILVGSSTLIWL